MGSAWQIQDQSRPYFLTFQVVGWADIFSRKVYRDIILDSMKYCRGHKELNVFAYVIMTNHIHVIFQSRNGKLSDTIRDFKKFTSKAVLKELENNPVESRKDWLQMIFRYHAKFNKRNKDKQLWTHENHAVELDTDSIFYTRLEYIHNNPVRAGWVEVQEDYLYSSARNYSELNTLMEIDMF